ncbi:MAG: hypothetical protein KDI56_12095 [Xanthomonadales bacterium]|nr:hypothetical protein [Xanthomonadales bacterium]
MSDHRNEEPAEMVDSTSDDRIRNNVMRHEYRILDKSEKRRLQRIKDIGAALYFALDDLGISPELESAKQRAQEAVMWGVKHITR